MAVRLTERQEFVRQQLIVVAGRRGTATYGDVAVWVGRHRGSARSVARHYLNAIGSYEHEQGRPLLPAIVVNQQEGKPGWRFWELARGLGLFRETEYRRTYWIEECGRVYSYWGA